MGVWLWHGPNFYAKTDAKYESIVLRNSNTNVLLSNYTASMQTESAVRMCGCTRAVSVCPGAEESPRYSCITPPQSKACIYFQISSSNVTLASQKQHI